MATKQSGNKQSAIQQPTGTSYPEWGLAAVSAVLIAAAVGYMIWYGVTRPDGPPELTIAQVSDSREAAGGYLVKVIVKNEGYASAAGVDIAGKLMDGDKTVEESGATLDYVPQQSRRYAFFQFTVDPARYRLELRVTGMSKP